MSLLSPLLSLPAELRIPIFTYALLSSDCSCVPFPLYPALLLTCRQINAEATPLFYRSLTFDAHPTLLTDFPAYRFPAVHEGDCPTCTGLAQHFSGAATPWSANSTVGGTLSSAASLGGSAGVGVCSPRRTQAQNMHDTHFLLHLRPVTRSFLQRWRVAVRLDADARFDADAAKRAFDGCAALYVSGVQASFGVAGVENLRNLQKVRRVRKCEVRGTGCSEREGGFGRWLEDKVMSDDPIEQVERVGPWTEEKRPEWKKVTVVGEELAQVIPIRTRNEVDVWGMR